MLNIGIYKIKGVVMLGLPRRQTNLFNQSEDRRGSPEDSKDQRVISGMVARRKGWSP